MANLIKNITNVTDAVKKAMAEAEAVSKVKERFPLDLTRAKPKTKQEITDVADRVTRQQLGEHVTSGKPKDNKNLAGRSKKESQRVQALQYNLERTKNIKPSPIYTGEVGDVNVAIPDDQTISDFRLIDVNGHPIDSVQEGGSRYGWGHQDKDDPLFWASGTQIAQQAQNKANNLSDLYNTDRIMAHHLAMGPVSNNFAQHMADANLKAIINSDMSPQAIEKFNEIIRKGYIDNVGKHIELPHFVGIENPNEAWLQMQAEPNIRKWFNNRMKVPSITEPLGMPNGLDIQWAVTEPDLRNMEVNLTGHSVGKLKPKAELTDTANHNTYDSGIQGESLGHTQELVPFELAFPDATQFVQATKRPSDFTGTIQKVFPSQVVDPQHLDEMSKYYEELRRIRGFKDGGSIEDEFKLADIVQPQGFGGGGTTTNTFDNTLFRSKFGAFDPAEANSRDLLKAKGGAVNLEDDFKKADTIGMATGGSEIEALRKSGKLNQTPKHDVGKILQGLKKSLENEWKMGTQPKQDIVGRSIASLAGSIPDIANMLLPMGADYGGYTKGADKNPIGGSEWMGDKMQKHGLVSDVRRPFAEALGSFIDPFAVTGAVLSAPKVAKNVIKGIKATEGWPVGLSIKDVSTPQHHPFIGYINKEGKHELFNEKLAKEVDYHHSNLVKNLDEYDKDSTLRFVRNGSENRYSLLGNSAIDPYHPESKKQIAELSKVLQERGADPNAPFRVENMALSSEEAPYQGKDIGKLSDWYTAPPKPVAFHSTLDKAVDSHKLEAMPGAQWSAWLKSNAPKSAKKEAEATGLHDWLATQGKVTKEDIKAHTEANRPKVQVTTKGAPSKLTTEENTRLADLSNRQGKSHHGTGEGLNFEEYNELIKLENIRDKHSIGVLRGQQRVQEQSAQQAQARGDHLTANMRFNLAEHMGNRADALELTPKLMGGGTKFNTWQLPGGENYKETMFNLPPKATKLNSHDLMVMQREDFNSFGVYDKNDRQVSPTFKTIDEAREWKANPVIKNEGDNYTVPPLHRYGDEATDVNRVAHIRTNERPTADNKRALFMEESQSDWGQQGRDRGFKKPKLTPEEEKEYEMLTEYGSRQLSPESSARMRELSARKYSSEIPLAPYVDDTKDWTALGLKHALKQAVDEGHDYLAWTNGEQQAKRYNLAKQIDNLYYNPITKELQGHKGSHTVIEKQGVEPEDLEELVGKDIASKLNTMPPNWTNSHPEGRVLEGLDLQVGGEGMNRYYGNKITSDNQNINGIMSETANELMKQIGATERVKPIKIKGGKPEDYDINHIVNANGTEVVEVDGERHMFDNADEAQTFKDSIIAPTAQQGIEITPELRELILSGGLPHFHDGGNVAKKINLEEEFKKEQLRRRYG